MARSKPSPKSTRAAVEHAELLVAVFFGLAKKPVAPDLAEAIAAHLTRSLSAADRRRLADGFDRNVVADLHRRLRPLLA